MKLSRKQKSKIRTQEIRRLRWNKYSQLTEECNDTSLNEKQQLDLSISERINLLCRINGLDEPPTNCKCEFYLKFDGTGCVCCKSLMGCSCCDYTILLTNKNKYGYYMDWLQLHSRCIDYKEEYTTYAVRDNKQIATCVYHPEGSKDVKIKISTVIPKCKQLDINFLIKLRKDNSDIIDYITEQGHSNRNKIEEEISNQKYLIRLEEVADEWKKYLEKNGISFEGVLQP